MLHQYEKSLVSFVEDAATFMPGIDGSMLESLYSSKLMSLGADSPAIHRQRCYTLKSPKMCSHIDGVIGSL